MRNKTTSQFVARLLGCAFALGIGGCAQINDTGLAMLSTKVPAIAVVDDQLLHGEIEIFPDHTATVNVRAQESAASAPGVPTSCVGRMRYTGTTMAALDLRCSGGVVGDLKMTLIGETRGYGYGPTASGSASLAFGMTTQESRAHLLAPPGRLLVERVGSSELELQ